MVTGAGGSIGAELCRQIIQLQPSALVLYEMCEFGLYTIEKELMLSLSKVNQSLTPPIELITILGSVTDAVRVERVCHTFKVQTIYHAAAYKHVPMVEKNPGQGIWNNIFGTAAWAVCKVPKILFQIPCPGFFSTIGTCL